jgi:hypothetical protein
MLTASITSITIATVTITYQFTNDRSTVLYVFDGLTRTYQSSEQIIDHSLAYVIDRNGKIYVGKFIVPIPKGLKVEAPEIPYLTMLAPGATLQGNIDLNLPIRMNHPYLDLEDTEQLTIIQNIVIQIGFIDSASISADEAVIEPALGIRKRLFRCDYGYGIEYQEFEEIPLSLDGVKIQYVLPRSIN